MKEQFALLIAEDEPTLGSLVCEYLRSRAYEVHYAANGQEAIELYLSTKPDLLVLDIMMPRLDGLEVAQKVRQDNPQVPIIFLTAKSQSKDVVEGFKAGANDYLKKPFSMEELAIRIESLLGRLHQSDEQDVFSVGRWEFNHIKQSLRLEELQLSLTHREAELLYYLIQNKNQVLDRSFILKKLWTDDDFLFGEKYGCFYQQAAQKTQSRPRCPNSQRSGTGL